MKPVLKLLATSTLSVLVGTTTGILTAIGLYQIFPALYRQMENLPLGSDLGYAAGFDFLMLAFGLFVLISNTMAALTSIAVWSLFQRNKLTPPPDPSP